MQSERIPSTPVSIHCRQPQTKRIYSPMSHCGSEPKLDEQASKSPENAGERWSSLENSIRDTRKNVEGDGSGIGKKCVRRPVCGLGRVCPEAAHMDFSRYGDYLQTRPSHSATRTGHHPAPSRPTLHSYQPVQATPPRISETASAWQRASRLSATA